MSDSLEEMIARYLEGIAGEDEVRRLEDRLRADPGARRALLRAAGQDVELRRLLGEEREEAGLVEASARRRWIIAVAGLAAAVLAAAAAALWRPGPRDADSDPAMVSRPRIPAGAPAEGGPGRTAAAPADEVERAPDVPGMPESDRSDARAETAREPSVDPVPGTRAARTPPIQIAPVQPIPKVGSTVVVVASLVRVDGKAFAVAQGGRRPARAGQDVLLGGGLETEDGTAWVRYKDGTELRLEEKTLVEKLSDDGRCVHLTRGAISATVRSQPPGLRFAVVTPQARAEVVGTRFAVSVGADATRLDVDEGRVRLWRLSDGESVEVGAGYTALAAPGWALRPVPQEDVNPIKVESAIHKGIEYLRGKRIDNRNGNVLIFLTFVHAGVPASDPDLQALLKDALETDLEHTYQVALTAMAFEEFDRVKYQGRIHQCAQFLADNIGPKGQTRYGQPTTFTEGIATADTAAPVRSQKGGPKVYDPPSNGASREKPPVARIIQVRQKRPGPGDHDHSNMQYAALGLRACHDAGMRFESALLKLVEEWWREAQDNDSGVKE